MRIPLVLASALLGFLMFLPNATFAETANDHVTTKPLATTIMSGGVSPVVSADSTSYNAETGRYLLSGNVRIKFSGRTIATDFAKISNTLWVFTQGNSHLYDGELDFYGDTSYAELTGDGIWFYGKRCGVSRPGLTIQADSMYYDWDKHTATFDGHVLCNNQKGRDEAASHLVFDFDKNEITR